MNQMVDLDALEKIPVTIQDLSIFSSEIDGETRLNAPIPFGEAPEIEYLIEKFLPLGILGMIVATGGVGKTISNSISILCCYRERFFWHED